MPPFKIRDLQFQRILYSFMSREYNDFKQWNTFFLNPFYFEFILFLNLYVFYFNKSQLDIGIHGETPPMPDDVTIDVEDYYKEFVQIRENLIHAYSSQMFLVNGNPFPYR